MGERRNESKIHVLLIQEGYAFTAEVSLYLLEKAVRCKCSRVCVLGSLHALTTYSVGKTCILIGPAFVKYSGLEVACLYYSINRDFRDNTGGNKNQNNETKQLKLSSKHD